MNLFKISPMNVSVLRCDLCIGLVVLVIIFFRDWLKRTIDIVNSHTPKKEEEEEEEEEEFDPTSGIRAWFI